MTEPLLEIEMKFRVPNLAEYEQIARERLGVEFGAPKREDDLFFRNDALGFPDQGKSLRIRRRDDYLAATFKGPRLDAQTKTREELELPLANATGSVDDAQREWTTFFERLGFAPAARVVKTRRRASLSYSSREFELTLDWNSTRRKRSYLSLPNPSICVRPRRKAIWRSRWKRRRASRSTRSNAALRLTGIIGANDRNLGKFGKKATFLLIISGRFARD